MLLKLYFLDHKSPKHLIELKMFGELKIELKVYDHSITKPY